MKMWVRLSSLLVCSALWACGGGNTESPAPLPAGPMKLAASAVGAKALRLEWQSAQGASHYNISQRLTSNGAFQPIATKLVATSFDVSVELHGLDWASLAFRVEACNETGCIQEDLQALEPRLLAMIGRATAANPGSADSFGAAVATSLDGTTFAIGSPGEDGDGQGDAPNGSAPEAGAVYVFTRELGQLRQSAYVKAPYAHAGDSFGHSLALSADGKTLVIGAPSASDDVDGSLAFTGATYVFIRVEGQWIFDARLKPSTPRFQGRFGERVAISAKGDRVVVGAARLDSSTKGGVVVYDLADGEVLAERTWHRGLELGATTNSDGFGMSGLALSADGKTLAVGAEFDGKSGAAHVYQLLGHSIHALLALPQGMLTAPPSVPDSDDPAAEDRFGASLSLSGAGDVLAVGAPWDWRSVNGGVYPDVYSGDPNVGIGRMRWIGAVHVYRRGGDSSWAREAFIKPAGFLTNGDGTQAFEGEFGRAVSLSADGSLLAIGHPGESGMTGGVLTGPGVDDINFRGAGAVQLYERSTATWNLKSFVKANKPRGGAEFGSALALSLDRSSLVVGAPNEELTDDTLALKAYPLAGAAYLY